MALDNGTIRIQGARPLCIPSRGSNSSRLRESPSRENIREDAAIPAILHSGESGDVMTILTELREQSSQILRKLIQDDVNNDKKMMVPKRVQVISFHGFELLTSHNVKPRLAYPQYLSFNIDRCSLQKPLVLAWLP